MAQKVDIYFLVDATGSMGSVIANVKEKLVDIWRSESGSDNPEWDTACGLAIYRDTQDTGGPYNFISDEIRTDHHLSEFQADLDKVHAQGGGDYPEAQALALTVVAENRWVVGWRPGAHRIIAWVGDAPGHNPVSYNGYNYSFTGAISDANRNDIKVIAFNTKGAGQGIDTSGQATRVVNGTHGQLYNNLPTSNAAFEIWTFIHDHVLS